MTRAWGIAFTILSGGVIASCATLLGAGGDYELAASSSGSGTGGAGVSAASSGVGTGGNPAATASASSSATGGGGGGGGMVGPPSWHRYSFDMATATWSSVLLKKIWTDPNAPPSTGIIAACHLIYFDKLLVFTDAGILYIQDSGIWLPPRATHTVFPELAEPAKFADLYHLPSELNMPPTVTPLTEQLVIVDTPTIWTYRFDVDNNVVFTSQNQIPVPNMVNQPPWDTVRVQWAFNIWNKSKTGMPDVYATWGAFGDGSVYERLYNDTWLMWPVESSPLGGGKPGAPIWSTLTAAYFVGDSADGMGTIAFIGP